MPGRSDRITDQLSDLDPSTATHPDELATVLAGLRALVAETVDSFAGLHLSTLADGHPVHVSVFEDDVDPDDVRASIRVPLTDQRDPGAAATVLRLFARSSGAFVDLAADLTFALRLGPSLTGPSTVDPEVVDTTTRISLDADLPPVSTVTTVAGLTGFDTVNQALGVLIDQGRAPAEAETELARRASHAGSDLLREAERVVASTAHPAPGSPRGSSDPPRDGVLPADG